MTESLWLSCTDPRQLVPFATADQLRRFACACVWAVRRHLSSGGPAMPFALWPEVLTTADRMIDRQVSADEVSELIRELHRRGGGMSMRPDGLPEEYAIECQLLAHPFERGHAERVARWCASKWVGSQFRESATRLALQAAMLRDIVCNPFRSVAPDPAWLTSDVLALARGIYDDRAFDRMPILADALQDAGCDNDTVLTHCRDTNHVHVRGCWVVDLVLGKS